MDLTEYQSAAHQTSIYPSGELGLLLAITGLCGEAGELANKAKKIFRDHDGKLPPEMKEALRAELGDAFWYISEIATKLDADLSDVGLQNLEKLSDRQKRNVLTGSGDNR